MMMIITGSNQEKLLLTVGMHEESSGAHQGGREASVKRSEPLMFEHIPYAVGHALILALGGHSQPGPYKLHGIYDGLHAQASVMGYMMACTSKHHGSRETMRCYEQSLM